MIDIDSTPEFFNTSQNKRKRAVSLNHCIEKIMISKEIHCENRRQEVLVEIEHLRLTMRWITVYFLDHVTNVICFTYEAITLFQGSFDPKEYFF